MKKEEKKRAKKNPRREAAGSNAVKRWVKRLRNEKRVELESRKNGLGQKV